MKNSIWKIAILGCMAIMFSACETSDDDIKSSSCDFSDAESQAYYNTAMKFANAPTRGNCSTLKQASYNLIKKFEKCDATTKAQIAQLTAQWDNIDCNVF